MKVSIEYCKQWNYYPTAASLAQELKKHFSIDADLIASGGGVFEVVKNGELIFSKKKLGRFPEDNEIVNLIEK